MAQFQDALSVPENKQLACVGESWDAECDMGLPAG